jgi:hypothetical protein
MTRDIPFVHGVKKSMLFSLSSNDDHDHDDYDDMRFNALAIM